MFSWGNRGRDIEEGKDPTSCNFYELTAIG